MLPLPIPSTYLKHTKQKMALVTIIFYHVLSKMIAELKIGYYMSCHYHANYVLWFRHDEKHHEIAGTSDMVPRHIRVTELV